jgi:hypothetical protein
MTFMGTHLGNTLGDLQGNVTGGANTNAFVKTGGGSGLNMTGGGGGSGIDYNAIIGTGLNLIGALATRPTNTGGAGNVSNLPQTNASNWWAAKMPPPSPPPPSSSDPNYYGPGVQSGSGGQTPVYTQGWFWAVVGGFVFVLVTGTTVALVLRRKP